MQGGGLQSLMALIELYLIDLIILMAEFTRCLSMSEALALRNDLIHGTQSEADIIEWKKKRNEYIEKMHLCLEQSGHPVIKHKLQYVITVSKGKFQLLIIVVIVVRYCI